MKKLISVLLAVSLLLIIAACGNTGDNTGVAEDIENGAEDIVEDTKDMADDMMDDTKDFADDMTNGADDTPVNMPDDTIDGTMEDTETVQ